MASHRQVAEHLFTYFDIAMTRRLNGSKAPNGHNTEAMCFINVIITLCREKAPIAHFKTQCSIGDVVGRKAKAVCLKQYFVLL
jgi:hypothetical protein